MRPLFSDEDHEERSLCIGRPEPIQQYAARDGISGTPGQAR